MSKCARRAFLFNLIILVRRYSKNTTKSFKGRSFSMRMDARPWVLSAEFLKALEEKNADNVNSILDAGFDIDVNLMFCRNAINICVTNGWYEMAKLLIRRGCSLSLRDERGQTPLIVAVRQSDFRLVKLLLENRADITCKDLNSKNALHYACEMNNIRIVQLLTEYSNPKIVNTRSCHMRTPLACACRHGNRNLIEHLIAKGADVNAADYFGNTPLHYILLNEQCTTEMLNLLLDAGANMNHLNSSHETPLLSMLGECSNNFNPYNAMPQCRELAFLLIERGNSVAACNNLGETALHFAVILNDEVMVRKLLNMGAEVDIKNKMDIVPLFYACRNGSSRIASLLLDAGADPTRISKRSHEQWTWHHRKPLLKGEDCHELLARIMQNSKESPSLTQLCRLMIRKLLMTDIEKRSCQLLLPPRLVNFIQLNN